MNNNEIIFNTMNSPMNNLLNNGIFETDNNNNLLIANSNIVNQKYLCREHGEPISYLCLDCMSKCICSECIVHGVHHNHDVLNIKKAYPLIYSKTQDLHKFISEKISEMDASKRNLEKKHKDIETVFKNEQILKFGLEIDFNFLLQANKKTTVDRYESEYKKLKMESDRKVDLYKQKIADAKKTLQEETNNNTEELKKIMEKLQDKQKNDKKLEEKNSEITKKNSKKFVMYDLKEKKIKLKEILKLLKQQMDALKREIDIFRRKGGHIYSTIASNLV